MLWLTSVNFTQFGFEPVHFFTEVEQRLGAPSTKLSL